MESFLATLITVLLLLYVLRWLFALAAPWLVKAFARRVMRKAGFAMPGGEQERKDPGKEGARRYAGSGDDMVLRPRRRQGQSLSDMLGGEYVPFTEI